MHAGAVTPEEVRQAIEGVARAAGIRRLAVAAVAIAVVALGVAALMLTTRVEHNSDSIVRSCELLNTKIVEAQRPPSPDSSTALLVKMILANGTRAQRLDFKRRAAAERGHPRLVPADCAAAANNP